MFETSYYNSRYFNKVIRQDDLVIKSSDNIEKIKSEYDYYYYLPDNLKRFFVQPFDFEIKNGNASYKMELINCKNLAEYCHTEKLLVSDFNKILKRIDLFKTDKKTIKKEKMYEQSKYLVVDKTRQRLSNYSKYDSLVVRINNAFEELYDLRTTYNVTISHGDLCFSNILWVKDVDLIKFIDPRGAKEKKDIYMDEYYDLAKLRHSIYGGYENIIYNKKINYSNLYEVFNEYLFTNNISIPLLKLYEASLFLSMIPLHIENEKNVKSFLSISNYLLEEINY